MNQALLLAFIATIMGAANPSNAQTEYQDYAIQGKPLPITSSLDRRYYECIGNPDCALKDRLQIMRDINEEMSRTMRHMDFTCRETNYKSCIGQQAGNRRQWHKMHGQMNEMMTQIDPAYNESASKMNKKEPAAGDAYKGRVEDRKNWWRNMWDSRKEPTATND